MYLLNIPGQTMTLSLKYRLLCGSVVITTPFIYYEWYYRFFESRDAFVQVGFQWQELPDIIKTFEHDVDLQFHYADHSQRLARRFLSPNTVNCYWHKLLSLASQHFPKPILHENAVPFDILLALGADSLPHPMTPTRSKPSIQEIGTQEVIPEKQKLDIAIVIPAIAKDLALMNLARQTWLSYDIPPLTLKHFFLLSKHDDNLHNFDLHQNVEEDVLILECPHGYSNLLHKMVAGYKHILKTYEVDFFIRADLDVQPPIRSLAVLTMITNLHEDIVQPERVPSRLCDSSILYRFEAERPSKCNSQCAVNNLCQLFSYAQESKTCYMHHDCSSTRVANENMTTQEYLPRFLSQRLIEIADLESQTWQLEVNNLLASIGLTWPIDKSVKKSSKPFWYGIILYGNDVQLNDYEHKPHWNDPRFVDDLALNKYPPYAEASVYAISGVLGRYFSNLPDDLNWKQWAVEDTSMGVVFAGLDIRYVQIPYEIFVRLRNFNVITE